MPRSPSPTARARKGARTGGGAVSALASPAAASPALLAAAAPHTVHSTKASAGSQHGFARTESRFTGALAGNRVLLLVVDAFVSWWLAFVSIPVWLPSYCVMALIAAMQHMVRMFRPVKKATFVPSVEINGKISLIQAHGITTEILRWEPQHSDATTLVMVPGNPGAAEFYGPFLEEVHRLSGHSLRILCIGHPSHSARTGQCHEQTTCAIRLCTHPSPSYPPLRVVFMQRT